MNTTESEILYDESTAGNHENTYVIIDVNNMFFGINSQFVTEMVQIDNLRSVPEAKNEIIGVTNLRDKVIPVLDLRTRFGMDSRSEEAEQFISLLDEYEQGHIKWLRELENCINENREFNLATNPHKCKFGKWYDAFMTTDVMIANFLKKFDAPHKKIHGIAKKAIDLEHAGKLDDAKELIERTRNNVLALMLKLFSGLKILVRDRVKTLVLILSIKDEVFGLNVDNIHSVLNIDESQIENVQDNFSNKESSEMAKVTINKNSLIVKILNPETL